MKHHKRQDNIFFPRQLCILAEFIHLILVDNIYQISMNFYKMFYLNILYLPSLLLVRNSLLLIPSFPVLCAVEVRAH